MRGRRRLSAASRAVHSASPARLAPLPGATETRFVRQSRTTPPGERHVRHITLIASLAVSLVSVLPALGSLDGSRVTLVSPSEPVPINPPAAVNLVLLVEKDSSSSELIRGLWIEFPWELIPQDGTQWYDEIEPGRPAFSCSVDTAVARWTGSGSLSIGIALGESTQIGLVAIPYSYWQPSGLAELDWTLRGSSGSQVSGSVIVYSTPVERTAWGRIKALYRH